MAEPEIQRTTRDGVPVLWIPDERTPRLTLVFRTGRVDEHPGQLGINHLIEHLVLSTFSDAPYDVNGTAAPLTTSFQAAGSPDELADYLVAIGERLRDLPTAELAAQRRILTLEAEERSDGPDVAGALMALRWGSTPLGRLSDPELGLLTLPASELSAWAATAFTKDAAVLCWSGSAPPPDDLRLPLPEGPARPLPADLAEPMTVLPLAASTPPEIDDGIAISAVVPDDAAHLLAALIQRERLQRRLRSDLGAIYSLQFSWEDLLPGEAHVLWGSALEARGAAAAARAAVDDLMGEWPDREVAEDLVRARRGLLDELTDAATRHGVLIEEATRQLCGLPPRSIADRRAAFEAVDPPAIDRARRRIQSSAVVYATAQMPYPGSPFHELDSNGPADIGEGLVFETKGLRRSRRDRLTISETGIQYEVPGEAPAAILWTDLVSAVRTLEGPWDLTSRTGTWLFVAPVLFKDPAAVDAELVARVPAAARHAAVGEGRVDDIEARASTDLTDKQRRRAGDDLAALAMALEPDEELVRLMDVSRGIKSGVLAITATRTLHLFVGSLTTDVPHAALTGLRIEHPMSGVRLVLETSQEEIAFSGDTRSAELVAIRDLLDELRHPAG